MCISRDLPGRASRRVHPKQFHWMCVFWERTRLAGVVLNSNRGDMAAVDALLSVPMSKAWRVKMKYVLVTVALVFSTSAFGAVDASSPTELPGCELVGTVKI